MAMEWKEAYACHIPEIDQQHKRLFEIGNQIYTLALMSDFERKYDKISAIMSELRAYTIYHFDFEEQLIRGYGYPDIDQHRKEHDVFVQKLSDMEISALKDPTDDMILKLIMFVSEWISNHIVISDQKYVKYINSLKAH